ncbi:hypothetical protein GDO86_019176, partial [Hymenochirus boettgeri]
ANRTKTTDFVLIGIEGPQTVKLVLYYVLLILYIMTLCGNLVIIVLFLESQHLRSPLYFFLSNLALSDIFLSTSVVPNLLCTLLKGRQSMSIIGCVVQVFACGSSTAAECNLLTDNLCANLALWSWLVSLVYSVIVVIEILNLDFCGCNVINYIFCDISPLLEISCSNNSLFQLTIIVISIPGVLFVFVFIIVSYVNISIAIFHIPSNPGRQKAFSTCSSHLIVVCTYFGILTAKYTVLSKGVSLNMNKAISLLYTAVTPLLNPIIYSLRNKDIRMALTKWIKETI